MVVSKNTIMLFIIIAIVATFCVPSILATEFVVGDGRGWGLNFDYQSWAQGKEFYVGDTLVFKYRQGLHNVLKVNETGFQDCKTPEGTLAFTTGNDTITLLSPGKKWYICGFPFHCQPGNMKLSINVLPQVASPSSSPSTVSAPKAALAAFIVTICSLW